jgi:hypothetical protein
VAKAAVDQTQPVAFAAGTKQDLGHSQADQGGIGQFGRSAWSVPGAEQAGDRAVQLLDEGVEIGVHEASKVDVAFATPILGSLVVSGIVRRPRPTSESVI